MGLHVPERQRVTLVTAKSVPLQVPCHRKLQAEILVFTAGSWHHVPQYLKDIMQNWDYILEPTLGDSTGPIVPSALHFQPASTSQQLHGYIPLPAGQFSQPNNFQQVLYPLPYLNHHSCIGLHYCTF